VVVDCLDTSVEAIRYLHEGKRGRATLIPRVPICDLPERKDNPTDAGVVGYLIDLIKVTDEDRQLAEHMLGDVLVVENLDVARERHARAIDTGPIVTRAGEVLSSDGALCGGDGEDTGAHLIEVKREIRNLEEEVARLEAATHEAVEKHGELRKAIAQHQAALDATRSDAHEKEIALVAANRDIKRAEEAEAEVWKRVEAVASEMDDLTRLLEQTDREEAETHAEHEAAQYAEVSAREAVNAAEEIYRMCRSAVEEQNAVVMEVRVRAAQAKQQAEGDRAALARLQRQIEELANRDQRLHNDVAQFAAEQIELTERMEKDRALLDTRVAEAMRAGEVLSHRRAEYDQAREVLSQNELRLRELRLVIEESTSAMNERVLKEREIAMETEHLVSGTLQRHRVLVPKVLTDYHAREIPNENVLSRIDDLLQVVERMGEINLTAIEEYEERSERHQKLTEQRKDLESALTQLETAIRRMNRESRRLFRETFHEVNKLFQRMFPIMFGGGKAELRLTDPEDLLESGIDIVAMPPGKKLGMIELMSGGEKALTAISLILALFQYKPTPFCLLDEVDAPLDEANIGRFSEIVKEMTAQSQFIIITHSRQTVMIADVLYGITMETPGISKVVSVQLGEGGEDKPLPHLDKSAAVA
jgi:chromosome segregation protein